MKLTACLSALLLLACSSAPVTLPAPVPQALCAFNAVAALPRDPDAVTLGQAKEAAKRLKACESADAGAR